MPSWNWPARLHLENTQGAATEETLGQPAMPPLPLVEPPEPGTAWPYFTLGGLVLAVAAGVSIFLFAPWRQPAGQGPVSPLVAVEPRGEYYVGTLSAAADCRWDAPQGNLAEGARLPPGRYRLTGGTGKIHFDAGPSLLLQGPAILDVQSAASATIVEGRVLLKNNLAGNRFTLRTPTSTLLDLGTEFGVRVGPGGEEVYVFDGEVQRTADGRKDGSEQLKAGEARLYSDATSAGRQIAVDGAQFARTMPSRPANPDTDKPTVYEAFEYPPGPLPFSATKGFGWQHRWGSYPVAPTVLRPGPLFPGQASTFQGSLVELKGLAAMHRTMSQPIRMDQDGIHYFSFLFNRGHEQPDEINASVMVLRKNGDKDDSKSLRVGVMGSDQTLFIRHKDAGRGPACRWSTIRPICWSGRSCRRRRPPTRFSSACMVPGIMSTGASRPCGRWPVSPCTAMRFSTSSSSIPTARRARGWARFASATPGPPWPGVGASDLKKRNMLRLIAWLVFLTALAAIVRDADTCLSAEPRMVPSGLPASQNVQVKKRADNSITLAKPIGKEAAEDWVYLDNGQIRLGSAENFRGGHRLSSAQRLDAEPVERHRPRPPGAAVVLRRPRRFDVGQEALALEPGSRGRLAGRQFQAAGDSCRADGPLCQDSAPALGRLRRAARRDDGRAHRTGRGAWRTFTSR